jgi:hypothetical protein
MFTVLTFFSADLLQPLFSNLLGNDYFFVVKLGVIRAEADTADRTVSEAYGLPPAGIAVPRIDRHRHFGKSDKMHPDAGFFRIKGVFLIHGAGKLAEPASNAPVCIYGQKFSHVLSLPAFYTMDPEFGLWNTVIELSGAVIEKALGRH